MFSGIITDIGIIDSVGEHTVIRTNYDMAPINIGASIACAGICHTVVEKGNDWFSIHSSTETKARTTAKYWRAGDEINLEQSLKIGDTLDGHFVAGHVDDTATLISLQKENGGAHVTIEISEDLMPFIVVKGSVALDGVSLTVNTVEQNRFSVFLIPHTWQQTTLKNLMPGNPVNFEADMLARYALKSGAVS